MFNIHLVNQNVTILAQDGELLSQACADAGFPLDLVCGGKGKCGKCKVDIARILTKTISMDEAPATIADIEKNPGQYMKVVINVGE